MAFSLVSALAQKVIARFTRNGFSPETPSTMSTTQLPWFMRPGGAYRVLSGPVFLRVVEHSTESVYRYTLREVCEYGNRIFYIETPLSKLPSYFLVKQKKLPSNKTVFSFVATEEWKSSRRRGSPAHQETASFAKVFR